LHFDNEKFYSFFFCPRLLTFECRFAILHTKVGNSIGFRDIGTQKQIGDATWVDRICNFVAFLNATTTRFWVKELNE